MPRNYAFDTPDSWALTDAFDAGRYAEVAARARMLAVQYPGDAFLWRALGAALLQLEQVTAATAALQRALSVDGLDPTAWGLHGVALQTLGRGAAALDCFLRSIAVEPQDPGAYFNQGLTLGAFERPRDALKSHRRALALEPMHGSAWTHCGHAARAAGEQAEASGAYRHALCLAPDSLESLGSYGLSQREGGDFERARRCLLRALDLRPGSPEVLNNLGATLRDLERYREALDRYAAALVLRPGLGEALTNFGTALMELRRVAESILFFERAYALDPTNFSAPWNAALGCLSIGEFAKGWTLHEHRFAARAIIDPRLAGLPLFGGGGVAPLRILVCGEQGIGDEVMFGSMISDFRPLAAKLVVRVDPRLVPLFRRSLPSDIDVIGNATSIELSHFDAQIPLGSLGLHVRGASAAFEQSARGYLRADADHVRRLRTLLSPGNGTPLVGVSWRSTNAVSAARRSIELGRMCRIISKVLPGARFVSLQYGDVSADIRAASEQTGVEVARCPEVDVSRDLDAVAALIGACDAVMTIGNTTAHLCGALGKRATVLLPFASSWRWMAESRHTPWYDSLELFRKDTPTTAWDEVISAAALRLPEQLNSAPASAMVGCVR